MILLNFDEHDAYIDREEFNTDNNTYNILINKEIKN